MKTEMETFTVDTRPFLGISGKVTQIDCVASSSISALLDLVYEQIKAFVPPHAYGTHWFLRDANSGRVFDIGTPYAKANDLQRDHRTVRMVGLRAGDALEVLPIVYVR
ncbi:MAG: hypothetical protein IT470_08235 [Pseudomonadales bacterium]|nr:hypothetical protein [Pseudomonadales bacterium]